MNEGGLPAHVKDLVVRSISSVEQMELLVLLAADPQVSWSVPQLVNELRSSQVSINQSVKHLLDDGLLAAERESFRFAPASPDKAAACQELITAYRDYRVRVIELIYSGAGTLKNFSDAFKIKPKE